MSKKVSAPSRARSVLTNKNLKITPARIGVLNIFLHSHTPVGVDTLVESLATKGINYSTVYRTLETLLQHAIVQKVPVSSRQSFYELTPTHLHYHIICPSCETIEEITCPEVIIPKHALSASKKFSKTVPQSIEVFGTCNSCKK